MSTAPSGAPPVRVAWVGFAAFVFASVVSVLYRDLRHDDAYITFQFARRLATGEGFVFNVGEPVLGTTSPLHALVLAVAYLFVGEGLPVAAIVLGAGGLALQAVSVWLLLRRHEPVLALVAASLVALGIAEPFDWLALETNLFAGLVLATLAAVDAGRSRTAGVLLGLSFLARYDAGLLIPVAAFLDFRRHRAFPKMLLLSSFATVLPWLAWATWYFGSFLPLTLGAKQGLSEPDVYFMHYIGVYTYGLFGVDALVWRVAGGVAWLLGLAWSVRRAPVFAAFLLTGFAQLLAYAWIGPPVVQHWHGYLPQLAFTSGVVAAAGWVVERGRVAARVVAVGAVVLGAWLAVVLVRGPARQAADTWYGLRQREYEAVAEYVSANFPANSTFMCAEVGTLGYLTRLRMIDPFGLINETNDFPVANALPAWVELMERYEPDLMLVDSEGAARRLEQLTPYRIVKHFPWKFPRALLLAKVPPSP